MIRVLCLLCAAMLLVACGSDGDSSAGTDVGGSLDTGVGDAGTEDTSADVDETDTAETDALDPDVGDDVPETDADEPDAELPDADAALPDATPDATPDVPFDSAPDVPLDSAPDVPLDTAPDAPVAVCGNAAVEAGELCDGPALAGATCVGLGYSGGTLRCADSCDRYDFSGCVSACEPVCGARVCGPDPVCGISCGSCPTDARCTDAGTCEGVTPGVCGDGLALGDEACDGADLRGQTCTRLGFAGGTLRCATDCTEFDTSSCNPACVPDCSGRSCGPDPACGTSCGTCTTGVCNTAGMCEPVGDRGPNIVRFNTNVTSITEGESVRFTAVVTDPDGFDNIAGGTLIDPVSGGFYGPFVTSAGEGSYSLEVTWSEIDRVRSIDFDGSVARTFEAEFLDNDGHVTSATIDITLTCDAPADGACGGACRSFDTVDNCGGCGVACGSGGVCSAGACVCPGDLIACDSGCVSPDTVYDCGGCGIYCGEPGTATCEISGCICQDGYDVCPDGSCGQPFAAATCGDSCTGCGDGQWCDGFSCRAADDGSLRLGPGGVLQVRYSGMWTGVCDDSFDSQDAAVACRQLGGTLVDFQTSVVGPTNVFGMDEMACTGREGRLIDCAGDVFTTEDCSAGEHVRLVCERPAVPSTCDPDAGEGFVINEVLSRPPTNAYDIGRMFIEIAGPPGAPLDELSIAGYAESGRGAPFLTQSLTGTMPANGLYVIGGDRIDERDTALLTALADEGQSLALRRCWGNGQIDGVGWNAIDEFLPSYYGEGDNVGFPFAGVSLGRDGMSTDTNDNRLDFNGQAPPSPGRPNTGIAASVPLELPFVVTGSLTSTDADGTWLARPHEDCLVIQTGTYYYDAIPFTNTLSTDIYVNITADYGSTTDDGFMYVFADEPIIDPLDGCIEGNDDGASTRVSRISAFQMAPQLTYWIVISTYSASDTLPSYTLTIDRL